MGWSFIWGMELSEGWSSEGWSEVDSHVIFVICDLSSNCHLSSPPPSPPLCLSLRLGEKSSTMAAGVGISIRKYLRNLHLKRHKLINVRIHNSVLLYNTDIFLRYFTLIRKTSVPTRRWSPHSFPGPTWKSRPTSCSARQTRARISWRSSRRAKWVKCSVGDGWWSRPDVWNVCTVQWRVPV